MRTIPGILLAASFGFVLAVAGGSALYTHADTATSSIQDQIDASNAQIAQLQADIAKLQTQLDSTTKQKQTLQSAVTALNLNIQKLQKSITLTQAQIAQKDQEIGGLTDNISDTSSKIDVSRSQIADSLRDLEVVDEEPLIVTFLGGGTLSSFFDEAATLETLRTDIQDHVHVLSGLKTDLESDKSTAQDKRQDLANLNADLNQQKQGLVIAQQSQTKLLNDTKNQESVYQAQIAQKQAQEAKFESDLLTYEAQLGLSVTPGSLPPSGSGVLHWPLDNIRITQYFGNTDFATKNPQIYNGKGHTGVDLAASPGTPVKAALDGVVLGTGNTDLTCPGASFGKWVFIKHPNGLSTLYAHLSTFAVAQGDHVTTGQVIAYSDTTGYATGPHLHFGVYASSGSEIASFASSSCKGKTYTMPVGDVSAYLNPLSYLPAIPQ